MQTQYYIHVNGQQFGPLAKENLTAVGLTPQSKVWYPGAPGWVDAITVEDLQDVLFPERFSNPQPSAPFSVNTPQAQSPFIGNTQQQSPFAGNAQPGPINPNPSGAFPPGWTNWMPWAIVGTVLGALFSCIGLIFGIIGISKANTANSLIRRGYEADALVANGSAKTMTIISLVFAGVGLISIIFLVSTSVIPLALL